MDRLAKAAPDPAKKPPKPSPVKAMITWLGETDRAFRVASSMIDKTCKGF